MKRFRYELENVLQYKNQVLDGLKAEHAAARERVTSQQAAVRGLEGKLEQTENRFDAMKEQGAAASTLRLCELCVQGETRRLQAEQEKLRALQRTEAAKKAQVLTAKVDTSRYEKLRERRLEAYGEEARRQEQKAAEEFVTRAVLLQKRA